MRALVLSSHPLVDKATYKGDVLSGLVERASTVMVLYAGTSAGAYYHEARRRGLLQELRARLRPHKHDSSSTGRTLRAAAGALGVNMASFRSLGDSDCLRFVREYAPDLVHNLSALYIPKSFLEAADDRVVGAHYADLPRLRGLDTIRWSILLDHPLLVTHLFLSARYDMGAIVARSSVPVIRGDNVGVLRRRCQTASATGHLQVADAVLRGTLRAEPQREDEGTTFYRMGAYLRSRVDEILQQENYSHYANVVGTT